MCKNFLILTNLYKPFKEIWFLGVGIEVTGAGPTRGVFSALLHGGSPEGWVTGPTERRDPFQGSSFLQLDKQRYRPAFAEAPALRKASGGGASRRQVDAS